MLHMATASLVAEKYGEIQQNKPPRLLQSNSPSCPVPQEVVFLVGSSLSVGTLEFSKIKDFLVDVYQKLRVPPIKSAIIRFDAKYEIISTPSKDKSALIQSLQSMQHKQVHSRMGPPLLAAWEPSLLPGWDLSMEHKTVVVIT